MKMNRLIFGGLIAVVLLGFYVYAVVVAIMAVLCLVQPGCQVYTKDLNEGVITVLNLVGGLVSALVVAELAVTEPGKAPGASLAIDIPATSKKVVAVIATLYILVWVLCGVASLVIGYLQHPNVVPALTASAKSWLGLAVAAAYSYLGVRRTAG
jgi:hypothetical protein